MSSHLSRCNLTTRAKSVCAEICPSANSTRETSRSLAIRKARGENEAAVTPAYPTRKRRSLLDTSGTPCIGLHGKDLPARLKTKETRVTPVVSPHTQRVEVPTTRQAPGAISVRISEILRQTVRCEWSPTSCGREEPNFDL